MAAKTSRRPRIGAIGQMINPGQRPGGDLFVGARVRVVEKWHRPDQLKIEFLDDGPHWEKGKIYLVDDRYFQPASRSTRAREAAHATLRRITPARLDADIATFLAERGGRR